MVYPPTHYFSYVIKVWPLTSNGLFVCNIGNKFTYDCALGQSIIDITITSSLLADRVNDWIVHDENYFSDHKLISFHLNFKAQSYKSRNYKKANWSLFKKQLTAVKWKTPKVWSTKTIETESKKLNDDIIKVLDEVCPIKVKSFKTKSPTWWTTELHNLRTRVRNTQNEWRNISSNHNTDQETVTKKYNEYKTLRSEFSKLIKKSKRSSWRPFVVECDDIYLLNKII